MSTISNTNLIPMVCGHCGAPLPTPKGITRTVKCSFCGTMHMINWNSTNLAGDNTCTATAMLGLTGMKSEDDINEKVREMLLSSECPPLDVFERGIVNDIIEVGVPAFWFDDVTIRGHILYEKKYTYTTTHEEGEGDKRHTVQDTHVEWRPHTLDVSETRDFIVSANKEYSEIIKRFYYYKDLNAGKDIGYINSLEAEDVLENDVPDSTAFRNDIGSELESRMLELAKKKLTPEQIDDKKRTFLGMEIKGNQDIRNISVSGVEIDKKAPKTIWIALCKVLYSYKDKIYSLYLSHDGKQTFYKECPIDNNRLEVLKDLKKSAEEKEKEIRNRLFGYSTIATIALAISIFAIIFGIGADETVSTVLGILAGISLAVISILMICKRVREGKRLQPAIDDSWKTYEEKKNEMNGINQVVRIRPEIYKKINSEEEN